MKLKTVIRAQEDKITTIITLESIIDCKEDKRKEIRNFHTEFLGMVSPA